MAFQRKCRQRVDLHLRVGPTRRRSDCVCFHVAQTDHDQDKMVLCHYGSPWGGMSTGKNNLLLTLGRGVPILYIRPDEAYSVSIASIADGKWHHVALTMPKQSCLSAEIKLFIDGDEYHLESIKPWSKYHHVFFITSGRMIFGGLGYADKYYMDNLPYEGELDNIKVWSRTLSPRDIRALLHHETGVYAQMIKSLHLPEMMVRSRFVII